MIRLFWNFLMIGALSFGGGYGMISLVRETVLSNGWLTESEFLSFIAVSESTPGPLAVNMATFVGSSQGGFWGALVATLGVVFPSLVIISALAGVIAAFSHLTWVAHAFAGVRVCVCVLIFNAVLKLMKSSMKDTWGIAIFAVIFVLSILTNLSPVIYVVAAALAGVLIQSLKAGGAKK